MHNQIPRNAQYISRLKESLARHYGITAIDITPAKRGYYAETWRVRAHTGCYFLKMDFLAQHQEKLACSLGVIEYLCDNGIDFVGRVVKTREGQLYIHFDTALAALFVWIEGENVETNDTKKPEYQMLCEIYRLTRPGLGIPSASFSDAAAVRFYAQWKQLKHAPPTEANRRALATLERFGDEMAHCASRLSHFARRCQADTGHFYLTHGDAGGNFFVSDGRNYILDWDEVMYAPPERDAWVMGCCDWARKLFDDTLKANKISYALRPERLAFYCYHMVFHYLGEFMMVHPISDQSERIRDYLEDGWIRSRVQFADTL